VGPLFNDSFEGLQAEPLLSLVKVLVWFGLGLVFMTMVLALAGLPVGSVGKFCSWKAGRNIGPFVFAGYIDLFHGRRGW
jgi:hypothetical protein